MNFDDFHPENLLPELPPDDIVKTVTPWRRAMACVLLGLALSAVTLNFGFLQLLPAVGLVLRLLGFRALRRENYAFRAAYINSILQTAFSFPILILNTTIYHGITEPAAPLLTAFSVAAGFANYVFLWLGLRRVQQKAGMEPHGGFGLIVWYAFIVILALIRFRSTIFGLLLLVAYFLLLRGLFRLTKELDSAGYAVSPADIRMNNRVLAIVLLGVLALGVAVGILFFSSYPMDWQEISERSAEAAEVSENLKKLGFPEEILADLTDEDILACRGAEKVLVDQGDYPVNDGRKVTTKTDDHIYINTVYDEKELRLTGIAVKLDGGRWRLFHHFAWTIDPGFRGTEALQFWPACRLEDGWLADGAMSGQVLCRTDREVSAPYASLESWEYTSSGPIFGGQLNHDVFAEFSFPRRSSHQRGYVTYAIRENAPGYIIDSWINYVHQKKLLQYPALTAAEAQMHGFWNSLNSTFFLVQDAIQLYDDDLIK